MNVTEYSKRRSSETEAAHALTTIVGTDAVKMDKVPLFRSAIEQGAQSFDDKTALELIGLFPEWAAGMEYHELHKVRKDGKLWRVIQAHTSQTGWEPENAASLFEQINETHAGTIDDPIPYDGNMALTAGLYYMQDWKAYLCTRDTGNPVYNPLADLVGLYVETA